MPFLVKRSKVKVTGHQKAQEIAAYLLTGGSAGGSGARGRLHNRRDALLGLIYCRYLTCWPLGRRLHMISALGAVIFSCWFMKHNVCVLLIKRLIVYRLPHSVGCNTGTAFSTYVSHKCCLRHHCCGWHDIDGWWVLPD